MSILEQAIAIAASAHAGYLRENGEPYIFHPLRVMLALTDEDERTVGVLHDIVEKTGWDLDNLRAEGIPEHIVAAVESVSRRHGEEYFDFVLRAGQNGLGRRVKIADLTDNIRSVKGNGGDEKAREKLAQYERALSLLSQ